jgi:hypothetical protein
MPRLHFSLGTVAQVVKKTAFKAVGGFWRQFAVSQIKKSALAALKRITVY